VAPAEDESAQRRVRTRVVVHGRVQGVFFRDTLRREASRQGVDGWASNRSDGTVEAVFEGPPGSVSRLVELSRKGPRGADVEQVQTFDERPEGLSGFSIL
jgi:acylphosphatase